MTFNRAPLKPLIMLIQFNRWINILICFGVSIAISPILLQAFSQSEMPSWFIVVLWASMLAFVSLFVLLIFAMPSYLIFTSIGRLLEKYSNAESFELSKDPETSKLRKFLVLKFIINLVMFSSESFSKERSVSPPSPASSVTDFGAMGELGMNLLEKVAEAMSLINWFVISLDKAMPLFFLVVLVVLSRMNERANALQRELDEVV